MSIETAPPSKLISCILPKGKALPVLVALKREKGIVTANIDNARGTGRMTHRATRRRVTETEKEILTVVVPADRGEELFNYIYETAEIGRPHGGIMYQCRLSAATVFTLPDLPEEE